MAYGTVKRTVVENHIGVYSRISQKRKLPDGSPDICYDINYTNEHGENVFEKIGYKSEGYSPDHATILRQIRVKSIRHPELFTKQSTKELRIKNSITINEAWEKYKAIHLPLLKNQTKLSSNFRVHILPYFQNRKLVSIKTIELEEFKQYLLHTRKLKHSSVRTTLKCLLQVAKKMFEWKLINNIDAIRDFKINLKDDSRQKVLTSNEVKLILEEAKKHKLMYYIIKVALFTGLRLHEVLKLQVNNIDLDTGIIYVDGKTGQRTAYISNSLKEDFAFLIENAHNTYIFYSNMKKSYDTAVISKRFKLIIDTLKLNEGINDISHRIVFHTLRHTFCSWLARAGVALYTVGELAGHTSTQTTKRYAKLDNGTKQKALDNLDDYLK